MARPIANTPFLTGRDARRFTAKQTFKPSEESRAAERTRIKNSVENLHAFMASQSVR